ncbi:hypothetical protein D4764_0190400 [Takifugu flavidus]|uniref:Reverse transcriptase domain-containing protein n=1 Tax=Takifugu flavidus TaxID=433684 RepID=A0A5C6MJ55_9TELE|nr:hypothetical protein D4764_0190400 [Takifugu flavidus]
MSGLKMEDSGWYWCSRGDLQMPVQIIVREKPSTKQIQEEPSAEMLAEDTVIYTNMRGKRKPPVKGCPLSPILFIIFMDRISRCSHGVEGIRFGDLRIACLLFADDVVLLASSACDLQLSLDRFAAACEAAGMRISTSKSEAMVLDRKKVECLLRVKEEILPQVEEFKYLGVLFTSEGRMEREIDRRIGAASTVMRTLHRSVVVKRELSRKAKLSIYRSIFVPTLTYGHELWVMTERTRSRVQAAEMSFLRRVAGLSLRDRVRSSAIREELGVESRCSSARPPGRPRTRWRDYVSRLAWERLGIPPDELEEVAGEREVWASLLRLLPPRPDPDKRKQEFDEALVDFIVKDSQPFTVVSDPGFRALVAKLDPTYTLPSRQTVKAMVERRYVEEKEKAKAALQNVDSVSLTADMWTSINMDAYLAVTCHAIHAGELSTTLLGVRPFPISHTAENIAGTAREILREWALEEKHSQNQLLLPKKLLDRDAEEARASRNATADAIVGGETLQKKVPRNWEPDMRVVWQQQERLQILICDCSHVTATWLFTSAFLSSSLDSQSQGSIDGTTVFINETPPRVFTVTMSGLKMEDSGWYWCSRGDLQMPVQIIVREKPSTTAQPETFTSPELVSPSTTNEAEKPSMMKQMKMLPTGQIALVVLRVLRGSTLVASGWGLCILQMMWFCWHHQAVDFSSQWSGFKAKCEAAGMRISTSKSETMALSHKAGVSRLGGG